MSIEQLLADVRATYVRITPRQASVEAEHGALLVDIRPEWQRTTEIPGALAIERNHLEWRLDPTSSAKIAQAAPGQRWIVVCQEGYASSLAAASLRSIGVNATDVIGGIAEWTATGLRVTTGPSPLTLAG